MNAPILSELPARINDAHRLAQQCAETAVQHAVRCGQLLLEVKDGLKHGEFMPWIEANCSFPRSTASLYIKAAQQISNGLEISSLSGLFPSGTPGQRKRTPSEHAGGQSAHHAERVVADGVAQPASKPEQATASPRDVTLDELLFIWRRASYATRSQFVSVEAITRELRQLLKENDA